MAKSGKTAGAGRGGGGAAGTTVSSDVLDMLKNIQQLVSSMATRTVTSSEQYSVGQDIGIDEVQKTASGVLSTVMAQEAQKIQAHADGLRDARNLSIQCHLASLQAIAGVGNAVDKLQNINETDAIAATMVEAMQRNPALMELVLAKLGSDLLEKNN